MESMLAFAKGPLFVMTFGIMILGLARLILMQIYMLVHRKGRRLRNAPWRQMVRESVSWAIPASHMIRGTVIFSSASFVLHFGLVIVPIFLIDHVVLWERWSGANLPAIGRGVADILTISTLVCLLVLLACRAFVPRQRAVSQPMDYLLLLLIMVPFATGYLALHPALNPFSWNLVMLVHLLSAELLFVLVPYTKLAHVVLYVFDRVSGIHWQLRPGAGDQVAEALFGEKARV